MKYITIRDENKCSVSAYESQEKQRLISETQSSNLNRDLIGLEAYPKMDSFLPF